MGRGASALDPSSPSALILLSREERVMFRAEFEVSLEIRPPPLTPRRPMPPSLAPQADEVCLRGGRRL